MGTEHLLLGLLADDAPATRVLASLRIDLQAVIVDVEQQAEPGTSTPGKDEHRPFTPGAKRVLELTLRESQQLGHDYIGPEHLLLGLIAEADGIAARVLLAHGADLNRVRQHVLQLLAGQPAEDITVAATTTQPPPQSSDAPSGELAARLDALDRKLDEALDRLDAIEQRLPNQ